MRTFGFLSLIVTFVITLTLRISWIERKKWAQSGEAILQA